jgi:hypothetical protein
MLKNNPPQEQHQIHPSTSSTGRPKMGKYVYFAGLIIFLISLCLPVWTCTGSSVFGFVVLMTGWIAVVFLDPHWLGNLIPIIAAVYIFGRKSWVALPISCFILSFISLTSVYGPYLCGMVAGAFTNGTSLSIGGWVWIISLWVISIATVFKPRQHP